MFGRLSGIRTQTGQNKINNEITAKKLSHIWEECGSCRVFASYTVAFALQLRKKHWNLIYFRSDGHEISHTEWSSDPPTHSAGYLEPRASDEQ
jgi:hypothetical protein